MIQTAKYICHVFVATNMFVAIKPCQSHVQIIMGNINGTAANDGLLRYVTYPVLLGWVKGY